MSVKTVLAVALVCGLVPLGGCASMRGGSSRDLTSGLSDDPANPIDLAYVRKINREANRHFSVVLWVNPPHVDKPREDHN